VGKPEILQTSTARVMLMNIPKIVSATAVDDHKLVIQFDNSAKKLYNVTPLFGKAMFVPLKNPALTNV
jgi:hypothetical protein